MGRGTSSVAHGPESHDEAPAAVVSTADNRSRGVGHFSAVQQRAARRGGSVVGVCKKAPTTSASHGGRPPVSAHEEQGHNKRPSTVDWKRQGTARQDASRYDEKVEVSGSEDDVSRLKATGRPFGDSEPRCACLDMHVEHMRSSTPQLIVGPFDKSSFTTARTCKG